MKKRITVLLAALMLALSMSLGGVAFASGGHSFHGCKHHSQGYKSSHGKCHHHGGHHHHHHHHHNGGGDDHEDDD